MAELTHHRRSRSAKVIHIRIRSHQVPLSRERTVNFLFYFQLPFISIMNSCRLMIKQLLLHRKSR